MELKRNNILLFGGAAAAAIAIALLASIFMFGGSTVDEPARISTGVEVTGVPFSAAGQEYIPVEWVVRGSDEEPPISGVYFSQATSQADFGRSPPPDQSGYEYFVPYVREEGNSTLQLKAMLPNSFERVYLRIYAKIGGEHFWSDEFTVSS